MADDEDSSDDEPLMKRMKVRPPPSRALRAHTARTHRTSSR
jgi:hypothetical protein